MSCNMCVVMRLRQKARLAILNRDLAACVESGDEFHAHQLREEIERTSSVIVLAHKPSKRKMTLSAGRMLLAPMSICLTSRDREFRVNHANAAKPQKYAAPGYVDTAYYTDNIIDAVETGIAMYVNARKA